MKVFQEVYTILIATSLLLTIACQEDLSFEEPQPSADRDERKFKKRFQGIYLCLGDSSLLTINKNTIVQKWRIESKIARTELDTTEGFVWIDNQLYYEGSENTLQVELEEDTAFIIFDFDKTLFQISDDEVLRYYKGFYFLNFKESDDMWTVKTMRLDKDGILTIKRIYGGQNEIQRIKEMTAVEEIIDEEGKVIDYKVQPTKKELKALLKSDLFTEGSRFRKINN